MQKVDKLEFSNRVLSEAIAFLRARYIANELAYGNSFAQKLNNEAAEEMAEILFPHATVFEAKELLCAEISALA